MDCSAKQVEISELVRSYYEVASLSKSPGSEPAEAARKIYNKIRANLKEIESSSGEDSDCFHDVAQRYILDSVALLEAPDENIYGTIGTLVFKKTNNVQSRAKIRQFSLLTETRRKGLGCSWLAPGHIHDFKVYGGSFCEKPQVLIDPYLPPINLAATFIHEIDHLLRDRTSVSPDSWEGLRHWVAYDEILSSIVGGYYQIRLSHDGIWVKNPNGKASSKKRFDLAFDNTLFRENGRLEQMYLNSKSAERKNPLWFLASKGFLPCSPFAGRRTKESEKIREIFGDLYGQYFATSKHFDPGLPFLPFFPTSDWKSKCLELVPAMAAFSRSGPSGWSLMSRSERVMTVFNRLERGWTGPSKSCQFFLAAIVPFAPGLGPWGDLSGLASFFPGPLKDYVGACDQGTASKFRPGNEGVRTGNEGGRPCLGDAAP